MKWSLPVVVLLAFVVSLVVSSSSALTATPVAPPVEFPREDLVAGAEKEGALTVYTSLGESEARSLFTKFGDKYPFLQVHAVHVASSDVARQAEGNGADVYDLEATDMLQLMDERRLASYLSPEATGYPEGTKQPWGYYTAALINAVVIAYNTKLVQPTEAPKSLTDLLDPKWAGKIGIEADDWPLAAYTAKVMGHSAANRFWAQLGLQSPRTIHGHTQVTAAVAAGEVAVSPMAYAHQVEALKRQGEPIEWVRTDSVYAYLQEIAVAARAPHPNAARLFINWLLSVEGQNEIASLGRIPARPGLAPPATFTEQVRFNYVDPASIADPVQARIEYVALLRVK